MQFLVGVEIYDYVGAGQVKLKGWWQRRVREGEWVAMLNYS